MEHIIGALGLRTIPAIVRHFFLPGDWVACDHESLIFAVGRSGEILFARRSELAVIHRGLEVTESGGGFNSRRGSGQGLRGSLSGPFSWAAAAVFGLSKYFRNASNGRSGMKWERSRPHISQAVYVIFQGISVSFWSPLSNVFGRRPVFIITFGLYTAASLGLAFSQGNYTALILLRATQSIGGSAVISISYSVVADLITSAERGSMLGPMLASGILGPCIGPIIGGAVVMAGQPAWCFLALVIFGGIALTLILWTSPETRRTIVGNGAEDSGKVPTNPNITKDGEKGENNVATEDPSKTATGKGRLIFSNPFESLRLIFHWDTVLELWLAASPNAVWYLIQASIPVVYAHGPGGYMYGFKYIYVGLCYLSGGAGVIAGGIIGGKMMDLYYKHVALKSGFSTNKGDNHNIHDFPIEEVRSLFSLLVLAFSACVLVGFALVN
ncbi:hypothetical protein Daus18300_010624 [Diaporthe australafricana]|uniref:Major facilitator superfamily (MFS) profile domain-containing protein n=1 Tax=Diaporthe australafricana TaxID=127596 RepID=A0ABR3W9U1_9PEZI